jgi:hypothetical protein
MREDRLLGEHGIGEKLLVSPKEAAAAEKLVDIDNDKGWAWAGLLGPFFCCYGFAGL